MITKEELRSLFNELDPEDDKETWDKKVAKMKNALGIEYNYANEEISAVDIKEALKKIVGLADELESFGNESDPECIKKIVNEKRATNKRALERGSVFRRINPDTDTEDYTRKLREKNNKERTNS